MFVKGEINVSFEHHKISEFSVSISNLHYFRGIVVEWINISLISSIKHRDKMKKLVTTVYNAVEESE